MSGPERVDLSTLSFLEIQQLEREIGVKEFQRKYGDFGSSDGGNCKERSDGNSNLIKKRTTMMEAKGNEEKMKKTIEKWEPTEISSKVKPKNIHGKTQQKSLKIRDPRFDDLSGDFDQKEFEKGYAFLKDMDALDERDLKKFVKVAKDEDMVEEAKKKLKSIKRFSKEKTNAKKVEAKLRKLKKAEMAAVKEGKKPFFLKKSERKKLELAEKFKELKEKGKLKKYMERKRKRNAAKLKKALPE